MIDRDETICKDFKSGVTMRKISDLLGITRQRVQQILAQNGLSQYDGGIQVKSKTISAREEREKVYIDKYGLTRDEYIRIEKTKPRPGRSPQVIYHSQRTAAKNRGIEWKFNFAAWWLVWCESGKWEQRGRMLGQYGMCRYMDIGPYSKENVYIDTCSNNSSDQYSFRESLTGSRSSI